LIGIVVDVFRFRRRMVLNLTVEGGTALDAFVEKTTREPVESHA
jgi:hypothetical protein